MRERVVTLFFLPLVFSYFYVDAIDWNGTNCLEAVANNDAASAPARGSGCAGDNGAWILGGLWFQLKAAVAGFACFLTLLLYKFHGSNEIRDSVFVTTFFVIG